jgi:hypothetical protein
MSTSSLDSSFVFISKNSEKTLSDSEEAFNIPATQVSPYHDYKPKLELHLRYTHLMGHHIRLELLLRTRKIGRAKEPEEV